MLNTTDLDLPGNIKLCFNEIICPYVRALSSKSKAFYKVSKIKTYLISNGTAKIKLQEFPAISIIHVNDLEKYFVCADFSAPR